MEQHLLKTKFPHEAEQVPRDDLTVREKKILDKCINHEELSDGEFKTLKKILGKYREFIDKYEDTGEGIEKSVQLIRTEQDLLNILDDPSFHELKVNLPLNGATYELDFTIEPLTDSRAVANLQLQLDLFSDFNDRESMIYNKGSTGKGLSREEQLVYDKLVRRVNEKAQMGQDEMVNKLLSSQLRLKGSDADEDERYLFWKKFPFTPKMLIFMQVQDKLGLSEVKQEELFPVC